MAQLTLRTLLAYLDDTLEPALARQLGAKVAESELAQEIIERIKKVTRRRGLKAPTPTPDDDGVSDPNTVAEYLSNTLDGEQVTRLEETCLDSDVHLAEVAACHQILTLVLTEPVRVPPRARQRMYKLVPPPASAPNRRPGKTLPVGGVAPRTGERPELDDADDALLLGMGRFSARSLPGRLLLVATAGALAVLLAIAVFMALPPRPGEPPETHRYAAATPHPPDVPTPVTPTFGLPVAPPPHVPGATPPDQNPPPEIVPPEQPEKKPAPPKAPAVPAARADRVPLGKVEGLNVIVLARPDGAPAWARLDPAGESTVTGQDQVLCLPGFKADVQLDTGVKVHLWGNVPELLPARLLEARVRFHQPERKAGNTGEDFDADLTLLGGRVYLSTNKPAGGRVRVRFADQVWDVTLADPKTDVLVELTAGYDPGGPAIRAGGPPPHVEVQAAVVRGAAGIVPHGRGKPLDKVAAPAVVSWDSKTHRLTVPKPIAAGNSYYDKFLLVGSEPGKAVQKALTDMAVRLGERNGINLLLAEYLTEPPDAGRGWAVVVAVYAQAAVAVGDAAGDDLKPLIDILTEEGRGYVRQAVVNALSAWIAHDPGNAARLEPVLAGKIRRDGEPELILRLLRGYVAPGKAGPNDLDKLVDLLNDPSVAVRELAQWNLLNFVDPEARKTPGLVTDVAITGPAHEKYVKAWRARIDEIKRGPAPPAEPKP
jgi:hypothetical protein